MVDALDPPDLTTIGKQRTREELLDSLLEPSRKLDPAFTAYLVGTAQGKSYTGLLIRRDAKEVVLRDAQNKEVAVPGKDIELFQPSRVSLMPAALLAPLTVLGPMIARIGTGSFFVETIFRVPGMGRYFVESMTSRDYPMIMAVILLFGAFLALMNALVDLLYGVVDPRLWAG